MKVLCEIFIETKVIYETDIGFVTSERFMGHKFIIHYILYRFDIDFVLAL